VAQYTENIKDRMVAIMSWETVRADEFCISVTDGTHNSPKPQQSGMKLITSKHLKGYYIDFDSANWISEADYKKIIARSSVEQWDILFSMIGTIGTIYLEKDLTVEYACKNMGIFKFAGNRENAFWMYYYLKSPQSRAYIQAHLRGSTQAYMPLGGLREMPVPVPDGKIRRKIVSILRPIDEKIEVNNVISDNLLQQLHQLFVRIFNGIDMDVTFGDVIETTSGGTPSRKHDEYYDGGSICWVKSKELSGNYIHDTEEYINDVAVAKSAAKLLPAHSVLIAMYGATVGAYGIISKPMACNQAICALLSNEKYPYTYLFQMAYELQKKFVNLAVGSAQQNISQVLIKRLPIHSNIDIIRRFHLLAQPIHEEMELLQVENRHLSELRDSLLPKLMSGELDVSSIDL
jgi:type I restriction enzyme S subunit